MYMYNVCDFVCSLPSLSSLLYTYFSCSSVGSICISFVMRNSKMRERERGEAEQEREESNEMMKR